MKISKNGFWGLVLSVASLFSFAIPTNPPLSFGETLVYCVIVGMCISIIAITAEKKLFGKKEAP